MVKYKVYHVVGCCMVKEEVSVRIPQDDLAQLDKIIQTDPSFENRSQAIRYYIRTGLQREVEAKP